MGIFLIIVLVLNILTALIVSISKFPKIFLTIGILSGLGSLIILVCIVYFGLISKEPDTDFWIKLKNWEKSGF